MEQRGDAGFIGFVPIILTTIVFGLMMHFLAKDKGRNVVLWTILGLIPFLNFFVVWFLIGLSNLRFEKKLDELLSRLPPR